MMKCLHPKQVFREITREPKSKFKLTTRGFSIAFVMSVIEKIAKFTNAAMMIIGTAT